MNKNHLQFTFNPNLGLKEEVDEKLKSTITESLLEKYKPNKDFLFIEGGYQKIEQKRAA
tara:strand:+ start:1152 stop:1328 length:177 start_codon:yes stop_codon:yes gene_type:complete